MLLIMGKIWCRVPDEKKFLEDPHNFPFHFPHWIIKYHPDSLVNLNIAGLTIIVEGVLKLSYGSFRKEILNNEYLKIIEQTKNKLWISALAPFTFKNLNENFLQETLMIISISKEKLMLNSCLRTSLWEDIDYYDRWIRRSVNATSENSIVLVMPIPEYITEKYLRVWIIPFLKRTTWNIKEVLLYY